MSVLIKGVEMPKGSHEIIVRIQSDGRVLDQWGHRFNQEFIAVPVPPHGRLIDANAIKRELVLDYAYAAADMVDDAPTIIPASKEGE